MALVQWLPLQIEKSFTARNGARRPLSKPIHAEEERNGPPSANQGLSTAKLRSSHVTCGKTPWPPPVLRFLLAQNLSPKEIAGSDISS